MIATTTTTVKYVETFLLFLGFLYPEFHYATPPPSYSISMQQYGQQVVQQGATDGDRSILGNSTISSLDNLSSLPSSPPPTYRSRIVGRVRPPLSGVMTLSGAALAELPPPYQNSSTSSSLDRLADVNENEAPGTSEPGLATPDTSEYTDCDQRSVSDPSSRPPLEGGVVVELLDTSTTHVITQTPVVISASIPSVPNDAPEALPSVRNIVQRFEDLAKVTMTSDLSESGTGQSTSRPTDDQLFNYQSLSTELDAHQNLDDEVQLQIQPRSFTSTPADQSHPRNSEDDDDDLCSVQTSTNNIQSNEGISVEYSCSSAQSSNVYPDNSQSHIRISMSDVDSDSINLLPDNSTTGNQMSQTRSTTTTRSLDAVCQSQPMSFQNDTSNVHDAGKSESLAVYDACVHGQSTDSRQIRILQPASNQSCRDFSRSQSLDDHEIGESGI